jgi:hypothetical protein
MNNDDKKRFARYKPDFKEPENEDEKEDDKLANNSKIGFVEKIDVNQDDLVSRVLREFEEKQKNNKLH